MKKLFFILFIFFIIGCGEGSRNFSSNHIVSEINISNVQYQKMLKVGINVNWAIFPKIIKIYDSSFPSYFAKEGFSTIRLRFDFTDKILDVFDYNKTKYVNFLKKLVNDCEANNLHIVLADGAEEFKNNPNEETLNTLVNNWILIAKAFKSYPKNLSYNLIIEPGKGLNRKNDILNEFYQKVYKEIRKIDKTRILLWAPDRRSNPKLLDETWYPENDEYIMAEWHNYAAGPKEGYEEDIPKMVENVKIWEEKTHIPTWFGAWMPGNYNHGDDYNLTEQIKFATFLTKELKKAGIPFAINADTQFFDYENRKWNNRYPVVKAIIKTYYEN